MRDTSGELSKRRQLLCLDEAVLRGSQLLQRVGQLSRSCLHLLEQPNVLDCDHSLISEGRYQLDLLVREQSHVRARHY